MRNYIDTKDQAKLIRQALKESFPGVKFSVRISRYAGGSSIDIRWTDGPNGKQVDTVAKKFQGSYFDGMTDYKGNNYHLLDGEPVSFGGDFVFSHREFSDAMIQRSIDATMRKWGISAVSTTDGLVGDYRMGRLYSVLAGISNPTHRDNLQEYVNQDLHKRSTVAKPEYSKTLARVQFAGDDGYGYNAVGRAS